MTVGSVTSLIPNLFSVSDLDVVVCYVKAELMSQRMQKSTSLHYQQVKDDIDQSAFIGEERNTLWGDINYISVALLN